MAEIDLVPTDYRRLLELRRSLQRFGALYLAVLVLLALVKLGLDHRVRAKDRAIAELQAAERVVRTQEARLEQLSREKQEAEKRLRMLAGLRGGVTAREMFEIVDAALEEGIWFLDWSFRRAGELVDHDPRAAKTGYFVVVPLEETDAREKAWRVQTHMEIHAQGRDHSTLAEFVRRLVDDPRIETVRVLQTQVHRYTTTQVVDFELAIVVRTQA